MPNYHTYCIDIRTNLYMVEKPFSLRFFKHLIYRNIAVIKMHYMIWFTLWLFGRALIEKHISGIIANPNDMPRLKITSLPLKYFYSYSGPKVSNGIFFTRSTCAKCKKRRNWWHIFKYICVGCIDAKKISYLTQTCLIDLFVVK